MIQNQKPQSALTTATASSPKSTSVPITHVPLASTQQTTRAQEEVVGLYLDKQKLKNNAEIVGYGYKTSNLMELEKISNDPSLKQLLGSYKVAVPEFAGITSPQIERCLETNGINAHARWDKIIEKFIGEKEIREAREEKKLPPEFLKATEKLADDIKHVFDTMAEASEPKKAPWYGQNVASIVSKASSWVTTAKSDPLQSKEVQELLKHANEGTWRLMVRSTGKEDTKELANAGGNESVANVAPTKADILRAIGRVVSSYLRPKSINQRLGAGDKTLFDKPLVPALLQRMIGEKRGGTETLKEIPVGCVVYSQEAEGQTKDVALLQCGFGHPEGVVESSVPVDTLYIDGDEHMYSVVKEKTIRLVPVEKEGKLSLQQMKNPKSIQKKVVISQEAAVAIKRVAQAIHGYYGEPMDLELIYQPDIKTVCVVQARPIVVPEREMSPSYIEDLKKFTKESLVPCSTVSAAGGTTRETTSKDQVITAQTLDDALNTYLYQTPNREKIIAVVVQEEAESTSHAAAVFRGDGKMILRSDEKDKVESWLQEKDVSLLIDPQNGVIINVADAQHVPKIKQGWLSHPLPKEVSIGQHLTNTQQTVRGADSLPLHTLKGLVEELKTADPTYGKKALNTILYGLQNAVKKMGTSTSAVAQRTIEKLEKIIEHANSLIPDIEKSFNLPARDIQRLLPIRFLEALLFQKPSKKIVESFSHESIIDTYNDEKKFIAEKLNPLAEKKKISEKIMNDAALFDIAYDGVTSAISEELENQWLMFVDGCAKNLKAPELTQFKEMMHTIESLDMMPTWLHFIFAPAEKAQEQGDFVTIYNELYNQFKSNKKFISNLVHHKDQLDSFDVNQFQDPKKFIAVFKQLNAFMDYFVDPEFTAVFQDIDKNQIAVVAALPVMKDFVEMFDQSIKVLKSNGQYGIEQQVPRFKQMLEKYMMLLDNWAPLVPKEVLKFSNKATLESYLNDVSHALKAIKSNDKHQFHPSKGFNVQAAAIGSAVAWLDEIAPKTCEDVFTTIHQSLLVITSAFYSQLPQEAFPIPVSIKKIKEIFGEKISISGEDSFTPSLAGVKLEKGLLVYTYNIPLRLHSAIVEITYNKKDDNTRFVFKFYGNEPARWKVMSHFAQQAALVLGRQFNNGNILETGMSFDLFAHSSDLIQDPTILNGFHTLLKDLIILTFKMVFVPDQKENKQFLSTLTREAYILIDEFLNDLVDKYIGNDKRKINNAFQQLSQVNNYEMIAPILRLFVRKGLGINNAIEEALRRIANNNEEKRESALDFLQTISDKTNEPAIISKIVRVLVDNAKDNNQHIAVKALSLLRERVGRDTLTQDYELKEVFILAKNGIKNSNTDYVQLSLNLLRKLVAKDYNIQEILDIVLHAWTRVNNNSRIRGLILLILKDLVSKGYDHQAAAEIAKQGLRDENEEVKDYAQLLLEKLQEVQKNK